MSPHEYSSSLFSKYTWDVSIVSIVHCKHMGINVFSIGQIFFLNPKVYNYNTQNRTGDIFGNPPLHPHLQLCSEHPPCEHLLSILWTIDCNETWRSEALWNKQKYLRNRKLITSLRKVITYTCILRDIRSPQGEIVPEKLHYQGTVFVGLLIQGIQFRNRLIKSLLCKVTCPEIFLKNAFYN